MMEITYTQALDIINSGENIVLFFTNNPEARKFVHWLRKNDKGFGDESDVFTNTVKQLHYDRGECVGLSNEYDTWVFRTDRHIESATFYNVADTIMPEFILFSKEFPFDGYDKKRNLVYLSASKGSAPHMMRKKEYFKRYFCYNFTPFDYTQAAIDNADIIAFGGGDTFNYAGLAKQFNFPKDKTYIGISAGSVLMGKNIGLSTFFDENEEGVPLTFADTAGFGYVNAIIKPHWQRLNNEVRRFIGQAYTDYYNKTTGDNAKFISIRDDEALWIKPDGSEVWVNAPETPA